MMRETPASAKSSSGGISKSYVNTSESKVHLREEGDPQGGQKMDYNIGCQKCKRDPFETRNPKCATHIVRHHDQDEREADGAMHWDVILPVLKGRFRNQLEKEFTDDDWLHCLFFFWKLQDEI